jgi:hypothetical protein
MFFPGSRYQNAGSYSWKLSNGRVVKATAIPLPGNETVIGYYPRTDDQRLYLVAARYLADPTTFWRLCKCQ